MTSQPTNQYPLAHAKYTRKSESATPRPHEDDVFNTGVNLRIQSDQDQEDAGVDEGTNTHLNGNEKK